MVILEIVKKELKELYKSKKSLLLNILIPFLCMFVGTFLISFIGFRIGGGNSKVIIAADFKAYEYLKDFNEFQVLKLSENDILYEVQKNKVKVGVIYDENDKQIKFIENKEEKKSDVDVIKSDIEHRMNVILNKNNFKNIVSVQTQQVKMDYTSLASKILVALIPYIIIIFTVRLNNPNAYYLTTKEKSDGNLKLLLITPITNIKIILAKWLTNCISCSFLSILFLILSMPVVVFLFYVLEVKMYFLNKIPMLILSIILFSIVFSIFQLMLGLKAKSRKDVQISLGYLPLVIIIPLTVQVAIDFQFYDKITSSINFIDFIPIINFSSLFKMVILNFNMSRIFIILFTNIVLVMVCFYALIREFNSEEILTFKD